MFLQIFHFSSIADINSNKEEDVMNEVTCIFYDLEGVEIQNISAEEGKIEVFGGLQDERQECQNWGSNKVIFIGKSIRNFHLPPTGSKKAVLSILTRRNQCKECKSTWWPQAPFADGKQRMTKSFVRYALELLQFGTVKDVAVHLGVSWDVIKDLHKNYLKEKYANVSLENVTYISIDEFSIAKGHKYMTVISDLKSGHILHVVEGRKKSDIEPFLKMLKKKAKKLRAVAMDMSLSYRQAFEEELPSVDIVFDKFHVMQLVNKAVDLVRKLQIASLDGEGKKTLKGGRFLPLWNYEDLDQESKVRLDKILEANKPLFIIHSMKEQLRMFWHMNNKEQAAKYLRKWITDAIEACHDYANVTGKRTLYPLRNLAFTLTRNFSGILNYFEHFITNGKAEGLNNKIKTLKRQAYGYRDMEYFKLRLYHLHVQKHLLAG